MRVRKHTIYPIIVLLLMVFVLFMGNSCVPTTPVSQTTPGQPEMQQSVSFHVYYVRGRGNDSNPGTRDEPFKTIQKAADVMVAGDTCFVSEGNYPEMVKLKKSGSADNPISFIARQGQKVTINGADKITSGWIGYFNYETWSADAERTFGTSSGGITYRQLFVDGEKMTLVDSLGALTQPKTWFQSNRRIFLYTPERETPKGMGEAFTSPDFLNVEGQIRDYAFDATGVNHVVIKDFIFYANEGVKLDPGNSTVKVITKGKLWIEYDGFDGPGKGKHIVFVTGDEEYRSEEAMPQMAKILSKRHGFSCTVLFAINEDTWEIDPNTLDNIPGLEQLENADLMVLFTRMRELPDEQMKYIIDYTNSGKPIIGLRTATHPFLYRINKNSPYARWGTRSQEIEGGYGRLVLGETWVNHWGRHGTEGTLGVIAEGMENHPIVRGCENISGPTDVYEVGTLSGDSKPVIMGQVLQGLTPDTPPKPDKAMMPISWIKTYTGDQGKSARVFTSTIGAAPDFESEGLRRLFVNATYWCLGMEDQIPARADVDIVGEYQPTFYGFGTFMKGVKVSDHKMK